MEGGKYKTTVGVNSHVSIFKSSKLRDMGDIHLPDFIRE